MSIIFLVRQKFIRFLKYIFYTYIYVYKSFSTALDKCLRKTSTKWRDGEIGEHKWKGITEYEIEKVEQTR